MRGNRSSYFDLKVEITTQSDPIFSESNMSALDESEQQYKCGKVVAKAMEELEATANAQHGIH